jgi:hypothetical protein
MKVKILRRDVSAMENGVRKGVGDVLEISKEEYKANRSAYAPLKINVKPKKKVKDAELGSKEDVQPAGDTKDGEQS